MAPAVLLAGVGLLVFGFAPRLLARVMYGIVGWSFLAQMLGSIGNLNHWILDTSLLHHIALAPATEPNWQVAYIYVVLGLAAGIVGVLRFNFRDLQNE
jgi:putative exporter of polyketide antibiotics